MMTQRQIHRVFHLVSRLTSKTVAVHRATAAILWFQILLTTPIVCLAIFISLYADLALLRMMFPFITISMAAAAIELMAVFARVTSYSDRIQVALLRLCCHSRHRLPLEYRMWLLRVTEWLGSAEQPLAVHTILGQTYTSEALFFYLMEIAVQFTLIISLDTYLRQ